MTSMLLAHWCMLLIIWNNIHVAALLQSQLVASNSWHWLPKQGLTNHITTAYKHRRISISKFCSTETKWYLQPQTYILDSQCIKNVFLVGALSARKLTLLPYYYLRPLAGGKGSLSLLKKLLWPQIWALKQCTFRPCIKRHDDLISFLFWS